MNIAVIGCGNMASKVVEQIHIANNHVKFYTYTPSRTKAAELARKVGGKVIEKLDQFDYQKIDYWLIGCKPQQVISLAKDLDGKLKDKYIVSMLAATSLEKLENLFHSKNIIRIMPNSPIGLGEGITLYTSNIIADNFINLIKNGSYNIKTKTEKELDELTVFSGSGPAYVFYFALSLQQKLESMGYCHEEGRKLINKLFLGSAKLMESTETSLHELVDQVTSKGGVTIEAIDVYKCNELNKISSQAIDNALKRTDEITQELRKNT